MIHHHCWISWINPLDAEHQSNVLQHGHAAPARLDGPVARLGQPESIAAGPKGRAVPKALHGTDRGVEAFAGQRLAKTPGNPTEGQKEQTQHETNG